MAACEAQLCWVGSAAVAAKQTSALWDPIGCQTSNALVGMLFGMLVGRMDIRPKHKLALLFTHFTGSVTTEASGERRSCSREAR